ncbi:MAG: nucleotidyltransferase domain-containing protein [Chthoniobacteraceae bacterium]
MSGRHGLKERTVAQIHGVLALFHEVESAVLFGSRAKGVHKLGSDIDLALYGAGLDWRVLGRIEDALDDLLLPYDFSLLHHHERTDSEVAGHIARVGVPFYRREGASASLP